MEPSRGSMWIAALVPLALLALYVAGYGALRASSVLVALSLCDSIWPCPVTITGPDLAVATYRPAIEAEVTVRLRLDAVRGP